MGRAVAITLERVEEEIQAQDKKKLPLTSYVQIYPRVSTPEQMKNVSAEMQQDKKFALKCGWTEDLIICDDRDLGVSGRVRMEDRLAFSEMIVKISEGKVKIVIAANVSRLFRDRWGREYSRFMEICFTYGVRVVIPNKTRTGIEYIYDFSKLQDVEAFRNKCEEAWSYIENQVGMMHAYRNELGYSGHWVGGAIPSGFTVDMREFVNGEENPTYQKYTPYPSWAEKVCWLTIRYRELGGNLNELFRELERINFLFPPLDETYPKELRGCIAITPVYEDKNPPAAEQVIVGYKIATTYGLSNILRQPANIGHHVYKSVIRYNNHPAIVPYIDFIYAFNRLSPVNLDGTPNSDYLERAGRYLKRHISDRPAYLKNHLRPWDEKTLTYCVNDVETQGRGCVPFYHFYKKGNGLSRDDYMVCALDVDSFFLGRFIERLQSPIAEAEFSDYLQEEGAEAQRHQRRLSELQVHIEATKSLMAKLKRRIATIENRKPDATLSEEERRIAEEADAELVVEINEAYRGHKLELSRLEGQYEHLATQGSESEKRRTYKKLMRDLGEAWEEVVKEEDIIELVELFVVKVVLQWISPQFYTLTIFWKDDEWETDHVVVFKGACVSPRWSTEEEDMLRRLYPSATGRELMEALPYRSLEAMKLHASILDIKRPIRRKEGNVRLFCLRDVEVMQLCGIDPFSLGKIGARLATSWHIVAADNLEGACVCL